jgi:riboflavin biosynthesis pyrimidine reductase
VLVEPGPTLGRHLIARNQADRAWVFRSPTTLGEHPILKISRAPDLDWPASGTHRPGRDELTEYLNPRSNLFHANTPSADLVLAMA